MRLMTAHSPKRCGALLTGHLLRPTLALICSAMLLLPAGMDGSLALSGTATTWEAKVTAGTTRRSLSGADWVAPR